MNYILNIKTSNFEIQNQNKKKQKKERKSEIQNLGSTKKVQVLKIKIHVAQNVGKVWIVGNKHLAPFGAISGKFFHGPKKSKNN